MCCSFGPLALMLQTTPSLNLHYESLKNTAPRLTCGVPLQGDKKVWEAVPLFSQSLKVVLALLHFPLGHILCPVHEASFRKWVCQLHLGAWEETAVQCG